MIFKINQNGTIRQFDIVQTGDLPTKVSDLTNDSGFLNSSTLPKATDSTLVGVIIGSGISVNSSGVISIPTPMQFKGTVGTGGTETSLPSAAAANTGYVYKVIEDGTYQSVAAKVGDLLISNGSAWVLVPSGDDASAVQSVDGKTGVVTVLPSGGTSGQILVKKTNTDYDTEWVNQNTYTLPTATDSTLGGVKIGTGITVDQNGVISVPTNVSDFNNDAGYLTEHQSLSNYVTLDGNQTITGQKTFSSEVKMTAGGTSDICFGILCAFKTNRAQITNFVTRNVYTNNSNITFYNYTSTSGQAPSSETAILTVGSDGTITAGAGGFVGNLSGNATSATSLTGLNATIAELNYLSGADSNIQDQIDAIPTYSISMSGNVITLSDSGGGSSTVTLPVYNGGTASTLQTWQGGSY